jgi:septal ring factor EnvC (AmiA/AmiB activator)
MEENHPHDDDFQARLIKFRKEHEERMKHYDDKIQHFQKKIDKVCKQIEKMDRGMKNVMIKKEEKQQEFLNLFNEHARLPKTNE